MCNFFPPPHATQNVTLVKTKNIQLINSEKDNVSSSNPQYISEVEEGHFQKLAQQLEATKDQCREYVDEFGRVMLYRKSSTGEISLQELVCRCAELKLSNNEMSLNKNNS